MLRKSRPTSAWPRFVLFCLYTGVFPLADLSFCSFILSCPVHNYSVSRSAQGSSGMNSISGYITVLYSCLQLKRTLWAASHSVITASTLGSGRQQGVPCVTFFCVRLHVLLIKMWLLRQNIVEFKAYVCHWPATFAKQGIICIEGLWPVNILKGKNH